MKTGKIVITDKVYFEYYQLYKPDKVDVIYYHNNSSIAKELKQQLLKDYKEYEASKQLVEVENVYWWDESEVWTYTSRYYKEFDYKDVINNQICKAKIENSKAIIIELIN